MATVPAMRLHNTQLAIIAELRGVRGVHMRYQAQWPIAPYNIEVEGADGSVFKFRMSVPDWEFDENNKPRILFVYRCERYPYPLYVMLDNKV